MGFTTDDSMVRVDFFKPSGKWHTTEAIEWTGGYFSVNIHEAFKKSLRDAFPNGTFSDMDAVCLEPYHENAHPLCCRNGEWLR